MRKLITERGFDHKEINSHLEQGWKPVHLSITMDNEAPVIAAILEIDKNPVQKNNSTSQKEFNKLFSN